MRTRSATSAPSDEMAPSEIEGIPDDALAPSIPLAMHWAIACGSSDVSMIAELVLARRSCAAPSGGP